MAGEGTTRRILLTRLGLLGALGGAAFLLRDRVPWPPLRPRFANGRSTPWLPLPSRAGLVEIDVAVNGAPLRAVVDTGAQFSAIDRATAARLGLPRVLVAPMLAYGVTGGPTLTHSVRLDLAMPGLRVDGVHAAALGLAAIAQVTARDFQLLIGRDVLNEAVFELDFVRSRVRFGAPGELFRPGAGRTIPIVRRHGAPMVDVRLDGHPLRLLLDTGASGSVALTEDAARAAGLLAPGRQVREARSVGLGGLSLDRVVRARSLRVGAIDARAADVQIYAPGAHAPTPTGLLGAGFLRQFHTVVDLPGDRVQVRAADLLLVPHPSEQSR
ncbi:MAG: aspartyl protease family protein [Phenylobacterium sp.]|uniref:aspartyl protease family protein n=1 Tax=Phenylobacterium sp. TaxID=1871053 RepID=UPI001A442B52|nr:aspartyl protease family protein [Phenylobacterium sp.]MBL8554090.1 aspartyl protease family protein [Phenylobacterium sp.]